MFKMREIKFRAWDKKRKEMWYPEDMTHGKMVDPDNCGSLIYCDIEQLALGADGTIYILDECGNFENAVAIGENYELMQFTGLKDSKGKEIYEGDIVSWKAEGAIGEWLVGIVKWEEDRFIVERVNSPLWVYEGITCRSYAIKGEFYAEHRIPSFEWDELEIIGNIYENPELLKEVENA